MIFIYKYDIIKIEVNIILFNFISSILGEKGMLKSVRICLKKYCNFKGRARRSEYWYFILFNFIIYIFTIFFTFLICKYGGDEKFNYFYLIQNYLYGAWCLIVLLPTIAVSVRRLHDIGKSGWNFLYSFIPIVGTLLMILWFSKDGEPGTNQYGENPKEVEERKIK